VHPDILDPVMAMFRIVETMAFSALDRIASIRCQARETAITTGSGQAGRRIFHVLLNSA
jgi:hypothetical protein